MYLFNQNLLFCIHHNIPSLIPAKLLSLLCLPHRAATKAWESPECSSGNGSRKEGAHPDVRGEPHYTPVSIKSCLLCPEKKKYKLFPYQRMHCILIFPVFGIVCVQNLDQFWKSSLTNACTRKCMLKTWLQPRVNRCKESKVKNGPLIRRHLLFNGGCNGSAVIKAGGDIRQKCACAPDSH